MHMIRITPRRLRGSLLTGTSIALLALGAPLAAQDAAPIDVVDVEGGSIRGVETDVEGVTLFKGVPYAAPTSGENRFRAAQPVEPWEGVMDADTWPDQVVQDINLNPTGGFWGDEFYYDRRFLPPASEDSLRVNVYTPRGVRGCGLAGLFLDPWRRERPRLCVRDRVLGA